MRSALAISLVGVWLGWVQFAHAFQIAPLGTRFEEKLTNEPTSSRARAANALGRLIKAPVHEEITRLAFGCPTPRGDLDQNEDCTSPDAAFASDFVLYGARWNDLPPFRLEDDEGRDCRKRLGLGGACRVDQTVRFSTQPDCWYCLFKQADRRAAIGMKIRGCDGQARATGPGVVNGNLMTRSHFGDLQFLHAMASEDDADPATTRSEVVDWLQFAWRVATGAIGPDTALRSVDIPTVRTRFGCSGWSVSDVYILGRKDRMLRFMDEVALGSLLHTVQDSFAAGHVDRAAPLPGATCSVSVPFAKPGQIVEFHSYAAQDGHVHDTADTRAAMVSQAVAGRADAIEASGNLVDLWRRRASWVEVKPYIDCLFELSEEPHRSSPGPPFRRSE